MPAPPPQVASVGPAIYSSATPNPASLTLTVDALPPDLQVGDQLIAVCCYWDWQSAPLSDTPQSPTFNVIQPVPASPAPWTADLRTYQAQPPGPPYRYTGMVGFRTRYDEAFVPTTFTCTEASGSWLPGGGWRIQTYAIRYATQNGYASVFGQPQGGVPGSTSAGGSPGTNQYGWPGGTGSNYTLAISMAFSDEGEVSVPGVSNTYETIATQAPISGRGGGWGIAAVGKWYSGTVDGTGWTKDSDALTAVSIIGRGSPAPAKTYTVTPIGSLAPQVSVGMLEACNRGAAPDPPYTVDVPDAGLSRWWEVDQLDAERLGVGTSSGSTAGDATALAAGDVVIAITQSFGTAAPGPQDLAQVNLTGSIGGSGWTLLAEEAVANTPSNTSIYKNYIKVWKCEVPSATTLGAQPWQSVDSSGAPKVLTTNAGFHFMLFRPQNGATWSLGWGPVLWWEDRFPVDPVATKETVTTDNGKPVEAVFWGWLSNASGGGAFQEGGWGQIVGVSPALGAGGVSQRMVVPGIFADTPRVGMTPTNGPYIFLGLGLDVDGYTF